MSENVPSGAASAPHEGTNFAEIWKISFSPFAVKLAFLTAFLFIWFLSNGGNLVPEHTVFNLNSLSLRPHYNQNDFDFGNVHRCIFEDLRRKKLVERTWFHVSQPHTDAVFASLPAYVVSFAGGLQRQESMKLHLELLGLSVALTTFEYDHNQFNFSGVQTCWMTPEFIAHNVVRPSDLSLVMKHVSIAYDIVSLGLKHALVLEDDLEFFPSFPERIVEILDYAPVGWDAVFLSECYPGMVASTWGKDGIFVAPGLWKMPTGRCTDAYLFSQTGAQKYLLSMPLNAMAVDWQFNLIPNTTYLWADPFICRQDPSLSSALNIVVKE